MARKDHSSTQRGAGDDKLAAIWNTLPESRSLVMLATLTESMELLSQSTAGMRTKDWKLERPCRIDGTCERHWGKVEKLLGTYEMDVIPTFRLHTQQWAVLLRPAAITIDVTRYNGR